MEVLPNNAGVELRIGVSFDRNFVVAYSQWAPRPGEDWSRGNDLGDGRLDDDETIGRVVGRIRGELKGMQGRVRPAPVEAA